MLVCTAASAPLPLPSLVSPALLPAVAAELRPHGQVGALLAALPDVGPLAALHAAHPLGPAELWATLGRLWPGEAGRRLRRGGGPATVEAYNSVARAGPRAGG